MGGFSSEERATAAAVLAVQAWELFQDAGGAPGIGAPVEQVVQCVIDAVREFDQKGA